MPRKKEEYNIISKLFYCVIKLNFYDNYILVYFYFEDGIKLIKYYQSVVGKFYSHKQIFTESVGVDFPFWNNWNAYMCDT